MVWWLTFHLLGMVLWAGGLLTVSRMAAYHTSEAPEVQPRLAWMEGRLYWLVTVPGAVISIITAVGLLANSTVHYGEMSWFHGKMMLVALLIALHTIMHVKLKALKLHPENAKKALFSAVHGTIGLTLIGILIMVKVRPF